MVCYYFKVLVQERCKYVYKSKVIEAKTQETLIKVGGDRLNEEALQYAGKFLR